MGESPLELDFRMVFEPQPGPRWAGLFREFWPAYRRWYFGADAGPRPDYATCRRMLTRHLPALLEVHERLSDLVGGDDDVARFLSQYRPPASIRGCTQSVWRKDGQIALVRNYDFAPRLCDGVVLASAWSGTRTVALTDCLVGVLDGMNEHGLAGALAFGGSPAMGEGFATTILLRAILESCATVEEATALALRVPVHMAYTVTLVDRSGAHATLFLRPDRPGVATEHLVAANHQETIEWPAYAGFSATLERQRHVEDLLAEEALGLDDFISRFLEPPLLRHHYARGSGTLYTAIYRPAEGTLELRWPAARRVLRLDAPEEGVHVARYDPAIGEPPAS